MKIGRSGNASLQAAPNTAETSRSTAATRLRLLFLAQRAGYPAKNEKRGDALSAGKIHPPLKAGQSF